MPWNFPNALLQSYSYRVISLIQKAIRNTPRMTLTIRHVGPDIKAARRSYLCLTALLNM